jgi:hypothetical protein
MHICDKFSRYQFVEEVKSTSAEAVIPVLSRIFAMFGTPNTVKSDNGPPFNGENFVKFSRHLGFKHPKVTPLCARANGCNERFMQSVKKVITTAIIEKKRWRTELTNFLKAYRATPHYTTGIAPVDLMFNYTANTTRLPRIEEQQDRKELEAKARINQEKARERVNKQRNKHTHENKIEIEDNAIVKQKKTSKLTPPYDPNTYKITDVKGTMITDSREGHTITRNTSHFKRVNYTTSSQDTTLGVTAALARRKSFEQQPQNQQQQQPQNQQPQNHQQQNQTLDVLDQDNSAQNSNETTLENREEIENQEAPLNNPTLDDPTVVD